MRDKEVFMERARTQVKLLESLIFAAETLKERLAEWDGKELYVDAVCQICDILPSDKYLTQYRKNKYETHLIQISHISRDLFVTIQEHEIENIYRRPYFYINLFTWDGVLFQYDRTAKLIEHTIKTMREALGELNDAMENYDKYAQMSAELECRICEYEKSVPLCARHRVDFGYSCYLCQ